MSGYVGEIAYHCSAGLFGDGWAEVIVVSGDGPNFCGHALLHCRTTRQYFHIAGVHDYPRVMNQTGFDKYLREHNKTEVRRSLLRLPNADGARTALCNALSRRWRWFVIPNNCIHFVEEILQAGGLKRLGTWSNCPIWERL